VWKDQGKRQTTGTDFTVYWEGGGFGSLTKVHFRLLYSFTVLSILGPSLYGIGDRNCSRRRVNINAACYRVNPKVLFTSTMKYGMYISMLSGLGPGKRVINGEQLL